LAGSISGLSASGVRALRGRRLASRQSFFPHSDAVDRWFLASRTTRSRRFSAAVLCTGGEMLFTTAIVLLAIWLLGIVGVYRIGDLVHVCLLLGLMFLLLAALKARDAALRPPNPPR
jgi:hypothetical protein